MARLVLFCVFAVFLQTTAETIAPIVIPLVVFGLAIGASYGFSLNGSRIRSIVGATASLYAAVGPMLGSYTTMPNWVRGLAFVVGIAAVATNERIQGGVSDPNKRADARAADVAEAKEGSRGL